MLARNRAFSTQNGEKTFSAPVAKSERLPVGFDAFNDAKGFSGENRLSLMKEIESSVNERASG